MKTSCLVVDDEPLALTVIEQHIQKLPNMEVAGTCRNAMEAFDFLLSNDIDLVILDVEMPEISGIELLKTLQKMPAVIITTAYRDFAIDAFDLDVIDYLLKPVSFERFFKAISKYYQRNSEIKNNRKEMPMPDAFIYVKSDRKIWKVKVNDINLVESLKDYVKLYTSERVIITRETISSVEEKLPSGSFIRTHRSYLVPVDRIISFSAEEIETNGHTIPIGRTYKNAVLGFLGWKG